MATKLSDQLKQYIRQAAAETSLRQVARDTGIDVTALSRMLSGERGISSKVLDVLAAHFELELRPIKRTRTAKGA